MNYSEDSRGAEVYIAKLYVFLLPFRMIMPFEFLKDIFGPLANYIDTIFLLIGVILWMGSNRGITIGAKNVRLFHTIRNSIFYLNLSSVLMACVIYGMYGDYNNKSPFIAIMPMILFYFQYLLMFLYNIRVFQILSYRTIVCIISKVCWTLLVIAYIQVSALLGIGSSIYDLFAGIIGGFVPSEDFYKIPLTASEAAGAGGLLGIFVYPFLYARYIYGDKKSLYQIVLWLIPLYFTLSSTAYILFFVDTLLFIHILYKKTNGIKVIFRIASICILPILLIFILSGLGILNTEVWDGISYMLFDKATDADNGSTVSRTVPYIINWGCFTEMPFMGVGNGLQGYFYDKYFPVHLLKLSGSDLGMFYERIHESGTIANGACFLPGYFSGYGIVGIFVLINFIMKLRRERKNKAASMGLFNEMFIIGSVAFLIMSVSSEMYCLYYAWFVLSLPFMSFKRNNTKGIQSA